MKHVKIILSLLVVVLVCMLGVFFAERATTPVIEKRLSDAANAALLEIFPDTEVKDVTLDYPVDDVVKVVYKMTKDGKDVGVIYKAEVAGFNPGIQFLLGINLMDDTIAGYSTLVNGETAGVGKDLLEHPLFAEQFSGMSMDSLKSNGVDVVAGVSAPITLGGVNEGLKAVLTYHGVNFKGEVVLSPEEQFVADYFSGETFTDVTGDYSENDYVLEVLEASNGGYMLKAIFNGYATDSVYMIGIKDGVVLGYGLVSTNESVGIGKDLVENSDFALQFENKSLDSLKESGLDSVAGVSAPITLGGVNESLKEVLDFYNKEIAGVKDTEAPVLTINESKQTTLEINSQAPNWKSYVTGTDNEDDSVTVTNDANAVVDMSTAGTYIVTYTAVDVAGNEATITIEFIISEEEVEFVLVPVPEEILPILEGLDTATQFHDEGVTQGLIKGLYTGRDDEGKIVSVFYDVISDNGTWTPNGNNILVQFDLTNNTIVKVFVYVNNATYFTSDYAPNKGVGENLDSPVIATVWEGVGAIGEVNEDDLDSVSGTTANSSFPSFIESVEEAIKYQNENNVGGAE